MKTPSEPHVYVGRARAEDGEMERRKHRSEEETRGTESAAFFSGIYGSSVNIKRNDARPHPARTRGTDERMAGSKPV